MPTFFEGLKRLISGEPVFRPGEDVDGEEPREKNYHPTGDQPQQPPASRHRGEVVTKDERPSPKVIPEAIIERVECRLSGKYMDISVTILNQSEIPIMLDKILILGRTHELDRNMRPGEAYEFVSVYNGERPDNRNYTRCEVQYRDEAGDYFSAIHNIEFEQEHDGTYIIHRIEFIPPVKDI